MEGINPQLRIRKAAASTTPEMQKQRFVVLLTRTGSLCDPGSPISGLCLSL